MITPVIFLLALFLGLAQSEPRLNYGASCPAEDWCDYGKWLWCHSNTCQCLHPHRQSFDLVHNRCVAQAGTECNVYIGDRDCTSNSFCDWHDGKGKCKCKPGFIVTSQRTCSRLGGQDDPFPTPLAIVENEIIDIPIIPATSSSSVKPEGPRTPFYYVPPVITRPSYSESGLNRANNFRSINRSSSSRDRNDNDDIGRFDFMSSWRRLLTLLMANRNTRMFFR